MKNEIIIKLAENKAKGYEKRIKITDEDCEKLKNLALTSIYTVNTVVEVFVLTDIRFTKLFLNIAVFLICDPITLAQHVQPFLKEFTNEHS